MVIGVGNDQFTWMYGTGSEAPRALGGTHASTPNVVIQIRRAGVNLERCFIDSIPLSAR